MSDTGIALHTSIGSCYGLIVKGNGQIAVGLPWRLRVQLERSLKLVTTCIDVDIRIVVGVGQLHSTPDVDRGKNILTLTDDATTPNRHRKSKQLHSAEQISQQQLI
jgi:hypothetical protein